MPSPLELAARAAYDERERHMPQGGRVPWPKLSATAKEMQLAELTAALRCIAALRPETRTAIEELLG